MDMMNTLTPPSEQVPLALHEETIVPDWVDYNGHMNLAYYVLVFDHATDALLDYLEMGMDYRDRTNGSVFVVESHVSYQREIMEGATVSVTTQILGADTKRLHVFHSMFEKGSDEAAATIELMFLHVNLETRRTMAFPVDVQERINHIIALHDKLGKPEQAGRRISLSGTS